MWGTDGVRLGVQRWTTAGAWINSPPSSIGTPSASAIHVCKRGDRFAALQPISMGLARLSIPPIDLFAPVLERGRSLRPTCATEDPPARHAKSVRTTSRLHATRSSRWGKSQPSYAFVEQPGQTNGVADEVQTRTLKFTTDPSTATHLLAIIASCCGTSVRGHFDRSQYNVPVKSWSDSFTSSDLSPRSSLRFLGVVTGPRCHSGPPHETYLCPRRPGATLTA